MEDVLQQPAATTIVLSRYNDHHRADSKYDRDISGMI